ncbi:hypothetical protein [Nocardioides sp.]|uniref:hypothetical protein n=1 Tax=Nocardioides sp. TaxID=35761 RepID=UPI003D0FDAEF
MKAGRPRWWAAGLSLCLLLGLFAAVVVTREKQRTPDQAPGTHPATGRPDRAQRAALAGDALRRLERGVRSGSQSDSRPDSQVERVVIDNARALRVVDFTLRFRAEEPGALTEGTGEWAAEVGVTWSFGGVDDGVAESPVSFTFRLQDDHAVVAGVGGGARRTPVWLSQPVEVARSPGVLVLTAGQPPARYLPLARRAAGSVRRVLGDWPGGLVVEVPSTATALNQALGARSGEYDDIAAVTTTVDGSLDRSRPAHVFVNPEVFVPGRAPGAQVVITHEAVHVATGAATATAPLWLVEGFADFVALRHVDLPSGQTASAIVSQVRSQGLPETLPADAEFATTGERLEASYEAAWLACRTLARLGSPDQLTAYYRAVSAGGDPRAELRKIFGTTQASFITAWRVRLQHLAR